MAISSMSVLLLLSFLLVGLDDSVQAFLSVPTTTAGCLSTVVASRRCCAQLLPTQPRPQRVALRDNKRWEGDDEKSGRKKSQGDGLGETAAGAVIGGLVAGPLGALFGASIGSNIGSRNAAGRAEKEETDPAQSIRLILQQSKEGLQAVQTSLETQQRFAKRLDADSTDLYDRAKVAMANSDDTLARKLLLERTDVQEKLKKVLIDCAEEKQRLQKMQENIAQLERRVLEVETLLLRNASAKAMQDSSDLGLPPPREDPLMQKFRDMGID